MNSNNSSSVTNPAKSVEEIITSNSSLIRAINTKALSELQVLMCLKGVVKSINDSSTSNSCATNVKNNVLLGINGV